MYCIISPVKYWWHAQLFFSGYYLGGKTLWKLPDKGFVNRHYPGAKRHSKQSKIRISQDCLMIWVSKRQPIYVEIQHPGPVVKQWPKGMTFLLYNKNMWVDTTHWLYCTLTQSFEAIFWGCFHLSKSWRHSWFWAEGHPARSNKRVLLLGKGPGFLETKHKFPSSEWRKTLLTPS